jgi:flagellin-like hook-associated protein FlgL
MAGITPIPTTRVGDYFIRQRLVNQVQGDQLDLFRLQTQVSTGRRITRPSEDAPAALRAIALQRTIQRKEQSERNLSGSRSVLEVAETALNSVADTLRSVRGTALESVSNLTSEASRNAAIADVDAAISALLTSGNANYNGRYLFAGSRTNELPYDYSGEFIEYRGNEKSLQNYVDLEQLFTTNLPGTEVFGGVSGEVRGSTDVDPQLTQTTLLTAINGGDGLDTNAALSINVTNGGTTTSSIVDLSGAVTIGDVIRRIEANPPAGGASIRVDIVDNGLTVNTSAGTIRIGEVSAGRAAKELGIFTPSTAVPGVSVVGSDLDPVVRKTTPLSDLFGTKANGRVLATNANNDVFIRSAANGAAWNGVTVVYAAGGVAGSETVNYDSFTSTLTVQIEDGESTANDVIAAINAEGTFTATLDGRDTTSADLAGTGTVNVNNFGVVTSGGSGEPLDTASGLILTNGGDSVVLDISGAETVEDFFNLISGVEVGLVGEINAAGNGINVRSVLSGADFTIGENGGTTATQLGIRTYTGATQLADFNRGIGVVTNDTEDDTLDPITADLLITARDGTAITVDLDTATTLAEAVTLINNAPGNQVGTTSVTASLTSDGRGIQLVDSSTPITSSLIVQGNAASETLGFLSAGAPSIADNTVDGSGNYSLNGYRASRADDLVIVARDGTELWIDVTGASTVQDVIDLVNNHPRNNDGTTAVQARLAATGNGIELVDTSTVTTGDLIVRAAEGSEAALLLGFVPDGATENSSNTGSGGNYTLTSEDRHTLEVDSVYNSLIRLRTALQDGDSVAIGEAVERIDVDLNRVIFARGEIGSRLQSLDVVETRLEDENVQLQSALSNEIDVDLVEAISQLTARQYALQASLQTAGSILNLSILDYI